MPNRFTLLVPPVAAIEAPFGLVRIDTVSDASPPLTLRAFEPAPLAVRSAVVVSEPPPVTAAAVAFAPVVVTVPPMTLTEELAPVANRPVADTPDVVTVAF